MPLNSGESIALNDLIAVNALKVSVCVITYNQEKFIRQCLQSIVDQETDFSFEVIVGDDCSTDGTRAIVREFSEKYPNLVKPIYQKKNIGAGCNNYLTVHRAARGEYVAHIDGDDVMLPHKLQSQVNVMDENTNCSASFHLMEIIDEKSIRSGKFWLRENYTQQLNLEDIITGHPNVGHSSIMYRRLCLKEFLANRNSDFIDLHIYVALAVIGPFVSINKKLGLYRIGVGASANEKALDLYFDIVDNISPNILNTKIIKAAALKFAKSYAMLMLERKDHKLFIKYWNLKISYNYNTSFADITIKKIAENKTLFILLSITYMLLKKIKKICY
jgi:glycosyltransferase involved in cell wall biosynthesis